MNEIICHRCGNETVKFRGSYKLPYCERCYRNEFTSDEEYLELLRRRENRKLSPFYDDIFFKSGISIGIIILTIICFPFWCIGAIAQKVVDIFN